MSDLYYDTVHAIGSMIFWSSSRALVMHRERAKRLRGPYILAANHHSPFDVPLLIRHTPQRLDFLSTIEAFRHPFARWFYGSMNAFPIDRSKPDRASVRAALYRLRQGRAVAIFPEGAIRRPEKSVTQGGSIRPGVSRLALMAGVPVLPAVVLNSAPYFKVRAWMPVKRVRYGLIYGEPISIRPGDDKTAAADALEEELKGAMVRLYRELCGEMARRGWNVLKEADPRQESPPPAGLPASAGRIEEGSSH